MAEEIKTPVTESPEVTKEEGKGEPKSSITPDVQEFINKTVYERLTREREKSQKEFEAKLEEERRLAKLSEEERQAELQKKYEKELKEREEQVELANKEIQVSRNILRFTKRAETDGFPIEFLDEIKDPDEKVMEVKYEKIKTRWFETLNKKLEEKVTPSKNPEGFKVNTVKTKGFKQSY